MKIKRDQFFIWNSRRIDEVIFPPISSSLRFHAKEANEEKSTHKKVAATTTTATRIKKRKERKIKWTNSHQRSETILNSFIVWRNFYARFCLHLKTIFHTLCTTRIIKNKRLNLHAHAQSLVLSIFCTKLLSTHTHRHRHRFRGIAEGRKKEGREQEWERERKKNHSRTIISRFRLSLFRLRHVLRRKPQIMQSVELVRN